MFIYKSYIVCRSKFKIIFVMYLIVSKIFTPGKDKYRKDYFSCVAGQKVHPFELKVSKVVITEI